ncbi:MAG: DUF4230 domain-containing protein [Thermoanaerobaculia bacterium]
MTRRPLIAIFIAFALLLIGVLTTAWFVMKRVERMATQALTSKEEVADLATLVTRVRDLNRLETATMRVTNISTIRQTYDLIPNALAGDELTLYAAGDVIAGVDLSLLQSADIHREPNGTIVVHLPPPQLLVSRLDNRTSHVIQRRTGVFRRADIGMEGRARQYAEQSIRNEAVHRGILPLAQKNAEARVAELLHTLGATKVRFEGTPTKPPS